MLRYVLSYVTVMADALVQLLGCGASLAFMQHVKPLKVACATKPVALCAKMTIVHDLTRGEVLWDGSDLPNPAVLYV